MLSMQIITNHFHLHTFQLTFNNITYNLDSIIEETYGESDWTEQEWGFPKGRRNFQEKDYDCAIREFTEETGYSKIFDILMEQE